METNPSFPTLEWPRLNLVARFKLFVSVAVIGGATLYGALPVALDEAGDRWLQEHAQIIIIGYLTLALLFLFAPWLISAALTLRQRATTYAILRADAQQHVNRLSTQLEHCSRELAEARQEVSALTNRITNASRFEIMSERVDQGMLYLSIRMRRTPKLGVGDVLRVRHIQRDTIVGYFRVIQVRSNDYIAMEDHGIDAQWVRSVAELHSATNLVPHLEAIYLPEKATIV